MVFIAGRISPEIQILKKCVNWFVTNNLEHTPLVERNASTCNQRIAPTRIGFGLMDNRPSFTAHHSHHLSLTRRKGQYALLACAKTFAYRITGRADVFDARHGLYSVMANVRAFGTSLKRWHVVVVG